MAEIPVHTASPINTNAPPNLFGASPSSSAARYTPADVTPSKTTTAPPPQPGASAAPRPTSPPRSTDSPSPKTIPAQITRAPPQQTTSTSPPTLHKLSIPTSTSFSTPHTAPPLQSTHHRHTSLQNPLPIRHHRPSPQTAINTNFHKPPTPYSPHNPPADLSHPPGYTQSRQSFDDRPDHSTSPSPADEKAYYRNRSKLSILDGHYEIESYDPEHTPLSAGSKWMWDTAVKWTKVVGTKLKEGEDGVWKRVNEDMER